MGHLTLVRHAQASFFGADYDQLSAHGERQARALGEHWAGLGVRFTHVYVGPRRRHLQTCELVAGAYRARGLDFPAPRATPELDEHHGTAVIKQQLGREDALGPALYAGEVAPAERERAMREFFRLYNSVMRDWARGRIAAPGIESWAEFRARSLRALEVMCAQGGEQSVAFTSGGTVSALAGGLLGLDEDRVIDLSIVLRNTALTEVSYSGLRRSLVSFNALPHLPDPAAATSL